jgi:hypothetical protein
MITDSHLDALLADSATTSQLSVSTEHKPRRQRGRNREPKLTASDHLSHR